MPEPCLCLTNTQRANYDQLPPEERPIVDEAYGVFEDFIRTNELESFEKRIFPISEEYERLVTPLEPSRPDQHDPLRDSFGGGRCGLSGLPAWIFDAYMCSGRRDKAWDFLCEHRDDRRAPSSLSIPGIVNLRLLSPDRPIGAEELPSVYLERKRIGPSDQREALSRAAGELITRFESSRGFSFTGYFFTRWLLRDAYAYAPFSDVIRAEAARIIWCEPAELADVDIRLLMNVRKKTIRPFGYALCGNAAETPYYFWYASPEFDAVFSIIVDSLMVLAESALRSGGDGFFSDSRLLSAYPGPFDFEDRRTYSWTEDEILSEVSSFSISEDYDSAQFVLSDFVGFSRDFARREVMDIPRRLIETNSARALSNFLSAGSVNSWDDFSTLFSYASKVEAGAEMLSVILSSQDQFRRASGARASGVIPDL